MLSRTSKVAPLDNSCHETDNARTLPSLLQVLTSLRQLGWGGLLGDTHIRIKHNAVVENRTGIQKKGLHNKGSATHRFNGT